MKLVSVGIDSNHIGYSADHVSADLFDFLRFFLAIWYESHRLKKIQHRKWNCCRLGSIPTLWNLLPTTFPRQMCYKFININKL